MLINGKQQNRFNFSKVWISLIAWNLNGKRCDLVSKAMLQQSLIILLSAVSGGGGWRVCSGIGWGGCEGGGWAQRDLRWGSIYHFSFSFVLKTDKWKIKHPSSFSRGATTQSSNGL